jgi:hypothetical protein
MADQAQQQQRPAVARHPPEFTLKQSFATWFKQFRNYCDLVQVPDNNRYRTLLSFLDPECFTLVENLTLTQAQQQAMQDNVVYLLLKNALKSQETRIPAGYAMKYRKQHENESIEQYAFELERLALDAYPNEQNIRENVNLIESFISGIRNDELAIKLLQQNFANLNEAVDMAKQYFTALQTRRFLKTESDFRPQLEKVYNVKHDTLQEFADINAVNNRPAVTNPPTSAQKPEQTNMPQQTMHPNFQNYPNHPNSQKYATHPNFQNYSTQPNFQNYSNQPNLQNYSNLQNNQGPANFPQNFGPNYTMYGQQYEPQYGQQYPYRPNDKFMGYPRNYGSQSRGRMQQNQQQRRKSKSITCYYCQKPGHYKSECFAYLRTMQQNQQQNEPQMCSYCGRAGHRATTCWHLNKPEENTQTMTKNPFRPT